MTRKGIANTLRGVGLASVLTAAGAFGYAAFNPAAAEAEVEIFGDSFPIVEVIGHAAGLSGIAELELAKRIDPLKDDDGTPGGPDTPSLG